MTATVGVVGHGWRADVTRWGAIVPWDGSPALDWCVAADDRWHVPSREVAVRQVRVGGTPVTETRLRIPGGDSVHRTWTVADGGGHTVVELRNESPLPIAVAFTRSDVLTSRPPADVPIQGIELPAESTIVLPVGHRASVTVALAHTGGGPGPMPPNLAPLDAVVKGWRSVSERASRLDLPDAALADAVVTARCELVLGGPPDVADDPAGFVLGVAELMRMAEPPPARVDDLAAATAEAARRGGGWDIDAMLAAAADMFHRAGERRAKSDVLAIAASRRAKAAPPVGADGVRVVAAVERGLACEGALLPAGLPPAWLGVDFECHGVPVGPGSTLSFAVRWHGERPAVLWEVTGDPIELTAPAVAPRWRTSEPTGETLWPIAEHLT